MKLVFYSGGQSRRNQVLHQTLSELVGPKTRKSLTYISFCSDGAGAFYQRAMRRYKPHGFSHFQLLNVDEPIDESSLKRAFNSDAIYLAGGNTFYFLHHLKKAKLLGKLRRFAKDGGVIAGLSAGGLIMTPTIALAGFPRWDADPNQVALRDFSALSLVNFEFFPHFSGSARTLAALKLYSKTCRNPVLSAEDGGGIVVNKSVLSLIGHVNIFSGGQNYRLVL